MCMYPWALGIILRVQGPNPPFGKATSYWWNSSCRQAGWSSEPRTLCTNMPGWLGSQGQAQILMFSHTCTPDCWPHLSILYRHQIPQFQHYLHYFLLTHLCLLWPSKIWERLELKQSALSFRWLWCPVLWQLSEMWYIQKFQGRGHWTISSWQICHFIWSVAISWHHRCQAYFKYLTEQAPATQSCWALKMK